MMMIMVMIIIIIIIIIIDRMLLKFRRSFHLLIFLYISVPRPSPSQMGLL